MRNLPGLLDTLNPQGTLVERHLWLIDLFAWIRGDGESVAAVLARISLLLDAIEKRPELRTRMAAWWLALTQSLDGATLLADYGFSTRNAFISEFAERLRQKILPGTPETLDAAELFSLVMPKGFDAQWLGALDEATLSRVSALLEPANWQLTVLEAITICTSQVRAAGFASELRSRMSTAARDAAPFHALASDFEDVRTAFMAHNQTVTEPAAAAGSGDALQAALQHFRERLEACRAAAASVYT
ncbi:MAG: recombinase, partial [Rhodoferax sp.]|nr:recombinase [Rhodoferax sp.]